MASEDQQSLGYATIGSCSVLWPKEQTQWEVPSISFCAVGSAKPPHESR